MVVFKINETTAYETAWRKLRKFHDEKLCTDLMMKSHSLPQKSRDNVKKQAQQLSFALTQAYEFSQAARIAGASTKALMAYYSLTALANVEILWRGDGNVSFDRRDPKFNSHGFELKRDDNLLNFGARPLLVGGEIRGLYGLWRKHAQHLPYCGEVKRLYKDSREQNMGTLTSSYPLTTIEHTKEIISFDYCFSRIPGLFSSIISHGISPNLARGQVSQTHKFDSNHVYINTVTDFIIHPCSTELTEKLLNQFKVPPHRVPDFTINAPPSGAYIQWRDQPPHRPGVITLPEAFHWSSNESYFLVEGDFLNEFGYFYVSLYIAGMITRYHPQVWIKEMRSASHASSLIDELVDHSLSRLPLLTLGVLEGDMFVYER